MTSGDGHQARPLRWRVRNQAGRFVWRFDVDDAVLPGRPASGLQTCRLWIAPTSSRSELGGRTRIGKENGALRPSPLLSWPLGLVIVFILK